MRTTKLKARRVVTTSQTNKDLCMLHKAEWLIIRKAIRAGYKAGRFNVDVNFVTDCFIRAHADKMGLKTE